MPKQKKVEKKKFVKKVKVEKAKSRAEASAPSTGGRKAYALLRGMHDILPKEEKYWKAAYHIAENLAEHFQFGRLESPLLEEAVSFFFFHGQGEVGCGLENEI